MCLLLFYLCSYYILTENIFAASVIKWDDESEVATKIQGIAVAHKPAVATSFDKVMYGNINDILCDAI